MFVLLTHFEQFLCQIVKWYNYGGFSPFSWLCKVSQGSEFKFRLIAKSRAQKFFQPFKFNKQFSRVPFVSVLRLYFSVYIPQLCSMPSNFIIPPFIVDCFDCYLKFSIMFFALIKLKDKNERNMNSLLKQQRKRVWTINTLFDSKEIAKNNKKEPQLSHYQSEKSYPNLAKIFNPVSTMKEYSIQKVPCKHESKPFTFLSG